MGDCTRSKACFRKEVGRFAGGGLTGGEIGRFQIRLTDAPNFIVDIGST